MTKSTVIVALAVIDEFTFMSGKDHDDKFVTLKSDVEMLLIELYTWKNRIGTQTMVMSRIKTSQSTEDHH